MGKLGEEEDEEGEPAIEQRRECTDLGLDLGEREVQVVCHASALAMTDEARREAEMGLSFFITSVSSSESLTSFDAAERNERFGRIHCQRGKESSCRGKRKRRVFLCRRTVKVNVGDKPIPASFLKIEGKGALVGAIGRRERDR